MCTYETNYRVLGQLRAATDRSGSPTGRIAASNRPSTRTGCASSRRALPQTRGWRRAGCCCWWISARGRRSRAASAGRRSSRPASTCRASSTAYNPMAAGTCCTVSSPHSGDGLVASHQHVWNDRGELLASGISHLLCRPVAMMITPPALVRSPWCIATVHPFGFPNDPRCNRFAVPRGCELTAQGVLRISRRWGRRRSQPTVAGHRPSLVSSQKAGGQWPRKHSSSPCSNRRTRISSSPSRRRWASRPTLAPRRRR